MYHGRREWYSSMYGDGGLVVNIVKLRPVTRRFSSQNGTRERSSGSPSAGDPETRRAEGRGRSSNVRDVVSAVRAEAEAVRASAIPQYIKNDIRNDKTDKKNDGVESGERISVGKSSLRVKHRRDELAFDQGI